MSRRKPPPLKFESWIERLIREGMERGEFDGLAGTGQPIADIDRPRDELWWIRQKVARENLAHLPPTLQIRKDRDEALARVGRAATEQQVREIVTEINRRIIAVNSKATAGPPSSVAPLDADEVVARWRDTRP